MQQINGFGRIGRLFLRAALAHAGVDVVAINVCFAACPWFCCAAEDRASLLDEQNFNLLRESLICSWTQSVTVIVGLQDPFCDAEYMVSLRCTA